MSQKLYEALTAYAGEDIVPMHMPGHKRNAQFVMENPYQIDITEMDGFDNLHHPAGIIHCLMERIRIGYGSRCSYVLVNGSTGGILASIAACCRQGDRILVARNSHRSVYNAIRLLGLNPVYVYPEGGEGAKEEDADRKSLGIPGKITVSRVQSILQQYDDIKCVLVTSPTYEGMVSPVREIAEVVHGYGCPLIVDEAHGAHFNWHNYFPETAVQAGADLVVESLHKTLPALTQTAVLHLGGSMVRKSRLEWALQVFQSSSPSYVLMAGVDRCFSYLEEQRGREFDRYTKMLDEFYDKMRRLTKLYLLDSADKERSKLVIGTDRAGISGRELVAVLRGKFGIEMEMSSVNYALGMTSVCDGEENFLRLAGALLELDAGLSGRTAAGDGFWGAVEAGERAGCGLTPYWDQWKAPEMFCTSWEADEYGEEDIPLAQAEGRATGEDIFLFPPGIPLVVRGERISAEILEFLQWSIQQGFEYIGVERKRIRVILEKQKNDVFSI